MQEPGIKQGKSKASKKRRRKEEVKQQVLSDWYLEADPPEGTVRAWTDGSEQAGVDGGKAAGYGVWFGALHRLNCAQELPGQRQTNNRAEMTAALCVLKIVPNWVRLQICTDSQLVVNTVLYWLAGWEHGGRKTKSGKLVENAD